MACALCIRHFFMVVLVMMKVEVKMEWIFLACGVLAGGGTVWGIMRGQPPKVVETNKVIEKMVEVDRSLTNEDLLKIPCSQEYMQKHGEGLCRELFCRMNTRGGATQQTATSKECEAISNILNKKVILKICKQDKKCIEFFDRRI